MIQNTKKIIFISSRQEELQDERNELREAINTNDEILCKIFKAFTFERDLCGRRECVSETVQEWVLKSDIYLGIFDREYSEPTIEEYYWAIGDKFVPKEIIMFIRERNAIEREDKLNNFLSKIMQSNTGHSCVIYTSPEDLLAKANNVLLAYFKRSRESFIISEEHLGHKLDGARITSFPEKLRRKLMEPICRYLVPHGRKGCPEYYKYDINGNKIDDTWESIVNEPNATKEIIEFYHKRYKKNYD